MTSLQGQLQAALAKPANQRVQEISTLLNIGFQQLMENANGTPLSQILAAGNIARASPSAAQLTRPATAASRL